MSLFNKTPDQKLNALSDKRSRAEQDFRKAQERLTKISTQKFPKVSPDIITAQREVVNNLKETLTSIDAEIERIENGR